MVPAVAVIIAGATGMVETSLTLANRWHMSHVVVGVFVLATLTSLPDTYVVIRLAYARRGLAVVSATLHSSTLNLVGGVARNLGMKKAVALCLGGDSFQAVLAARIAAECREPRQERSDAHHFRQRGEPLSHLPCHRRECGTRGGPMTRAPHRQTCTSWK
jgi:hypothetical protein